MQRHRLVWKLVDWLRDNPAAGWFVDSTKLSRTRVMTIGGARWRIRHEMFVGWNGYYLVFAVSPAVDFTPAQERQLRARDVYSQIESGLSRYGYEGAWHVYDQIYGQFTLRVTDLPFALRDLRLLPTLRFANPNGRGWRRTVPTPSPPPKSRIHEKRQRKDAELVQLLRRRPEAALLTSAIVRRSRTAHIGGARCGINAAFILDGPPEAPVEVNILPWAANARGARLIARRTQKVLLALGYQGEPVQRVSFRRQGGPDFWNGQYRKCVPATPKALEAARREVETVEF
jgi:hypothetical protein